MTAAISDMVFKLSPLIIKTHIVGDAFPWSSQATDCTLGATVPLSKISPTTKLLAVSGNLDDFPIKAKVASSLA